MANGKKTKTSRMQYYVVKSLTGVDVLHSYCRAVLIR